MRFSSLFTATVLAIVQLGCRPGHSAEQATNAQHGTFNDLVNVVGDITIRGTEEVPLFSRIPPLMFGNRVYVTDHLGNRVLAYSKEGDVLDIIGSKGTAPGQFQMPYGVQVDRSARLYVNDRGNQRVQIYDQERDSLKVIYTPGQNEQIFVAQDGDSLRIIVQGVSRCTQSRERCLFKVYDITGRTVRSFGKVPDNSVVYTWQAALDDEGNVYAVNVAGDKVAVYSRGGRLIREFLLASPSTKPFPVNREPKTPEDLAAVLRSLDEAEYTQVRSLSVVGDRLFVQYQWMNHPQGSPEFLLDIYDQEGRLMYYGINTPGIMHVSPYGVYFYRVDDEGYGSMTITEVEWRE